MSKHSNGGSFGCVYVTDFEDTFKKVASGLDARIVQQLEYIEFNLGVSCANQRYAMLRELQVEILNEYIEGFCDTWSSVYYYHLASILLTTVGWLRKGEYSRRDLDMMISHR